MTAARNLQPRGSRLALCSLRRWVHVRKTQSIEQITLHGRHLLVQVAQSVVDSGNCSKRTLGDRVKYIFRAAKPNGELAHQLLLEFRRTENEIIDI